MINIVSNLISIQETLEKRIKNFKQPNIIAVSKTFPMENILPLINHGHEHYGENKVQEAISKWENIKQDFTNIKLHMIGKLQTNKVKHVIPLFDYVHSLDSMKLAEKIANEQARMSKKLKIFIQVNIGNEIQKSGVDIENLNNFYNMCKKELELDIIGLMCLPPKNKISKEYFTKMKKLLKDTKEKELSMGMSNDYVDAAIYGATFLRIGSKIFGERN
ncbi:YggS family pyridoxal phosphate-dependent enzyme [Pelagibacterales bacterium SAG-MED20]|nr:YggS family pyridoxal phosphate-dependent enzyme [Pelagibacterales bacterium SAG-MED20]